MLSHVWKPGPEHNAYMHCARWLSPVVRKAQTRGSTRPARDEDLRQPDLVRQRIDDRYLFAGVIYKRLVPGGVGLAHRWRQAALEPR
jgi:hypothetical protein